MKREIAEITVCRRDLWCLLMCLVSIETSGSFDFHPINSVTHDYF